MMRRVFFDSNVLISAFIAHGSSCEVFEYCLASHRVYITPFVIEEIEEALTSKIRLSPARIMDIIAFLRSNLELIEAGHLGENVCGDPDDDFILPGALAAAADCLITGDGDPLVLGDYKGIRIMKPAISGVSRDRPRHNRALFFVAPGGMHYPWGQPLFGAWGNIHTCTRDIAGVLRSLRRLRLPAMTRPGRALSRPLFPARW